MFGYILEPGANLLLDKCLLNTDYCLLIGHSWYKGAGCSSLGFVSFGHTSEQRCVWRAAGPRSDRGIALSRADLFLEFFFSVFAF